MYQFKITFIQDETEPSAPFHLHIRTTHGLSSLNEEGPYVHVLCTVTEQALGGAPMLRIRLVHRLSLKALEEMVFYGSCSCRTSPGSNVCRRSSDVRAPERTKQTSAGRLHSIYTKQSSWWIEARPHFKPASSISPDQSRLGSA